MDLENARLGTRVLVQLDYRKTQRQGALGTIKKRYGIPDYTTFEVSFPDGKTELFWEHQRWLVATYRQHRRCER